MIGEHSRLVYRVAYSALRNWADAEDVVQETFLQLLRGSPDRVAEGAIEDERSYLARIAWRLAVRRKQRPPPDDLSNEILRDHPSGARDPEQDAVDSDLEAWLHCQIDGLPAKLRQPLSLAALGELTSPQIAAVLGIPEGSVRRHIHTARQILKKQMERRQR
jgi:RNA polymerase sigma-70 factor (ECF subfamily)